VEEEEEVLTIMQVVMEAYLVELVEWAGLLVIILPLESIQTFMDMVEMVEEVKFGILGLS
jgi:hypothetical protein